MSPPHIERQIEIVTPAFIAGANQRADEATIASEIHRGTYVKHGLRWWFRALAGGLIGSHQLSKIRCAESAVFGSTEASSRLRIGITTDAPLLGITTEAPLQANRFDFANVQTVSFLPRRNPNAEEPSEQEMALRYLAFGMQAGADGSPPARCFLEPGGTFQVSITISPPHPRRPPQEPEPEIDGQMVDAILDLWVKYGGLGGRWRHGLGAMKAVGASAPGAAGLVRSIPAELLSAQELVSQFLSQFRRRPFIRQNDHAAFSVYPIVKPRYLSLKCQTTIQSDALQSLLVIKKLWADSRLNPSTGNSRNHDFVFEYLCSENPRSLTPPDPLPLAGLALPIPFRFTSLPHGRNTAVVSVRRRLSGSRRAPSKSTRYGRRASPVWFRPLPVENGYAIVAFFWNCRYLPDEAELLLRGHQRPVRDAHGHPVLDRHGRAQMKRTDLPLRFAPQEARRWFDTQLPAPEWMAVPF
jgi:CRISPR type III-B/RAMP module RAMP protein Cmr1